MAAPLFDTRQQDNTGPNSPNSNSHSPRFYLLVRTVFTCDNGIDSFFVQSHVFVTETNGVFTSTGPSLLHGGTGAFVDLQGTGEDNGNFSTSTGIITGPLACRLPTNGSAAEPRWALPQASPHPENAQQSRLQAEPRDHPAPFGFAGLPL